MTIKVIFGALQYKLVRQCFKHQNFITNYWLVSVGFSVPSSVSWVSTDDSALNGTENKLQLVKNLCCINWCFICLYHYNKLLLWEFYEQQSQFGIELDTCIFEWKNGLISQYKPIFSKYLHVIANTCNIKAIFL